MKHAWFVTGTDTEVGKTTVSCALLHAAREAGFSAAGLKPVAAGVGTDGRNEDVECLRAASSVELPASVVSPYCFRSPVAPHIAAAEEGRPIAFATIQGACASACEMADVVIVEGVGGFKVPLGLEGDTADLTALLGLPVILVVGLRLGCLNHALLTVDAIAARGLPLAGWVANCIDPAMRKREENLASLRARIEAPLLGVVPYGDSSAARAAPHVRLPLASTDATRPEDAA